MRRRWAPDGRAAWPLVNVHQHDGQGAAWPPFVIAVAQFGLGDSAARRIVESCRVVYDDDVAGERVLLG